MNEEITVDNLAYGCSDHGELIACIEAAIHLGDKVVYMESSSHVAESYKETVSILSAQDLLGEEDAIKHLVNIKHGNTNNDFASALDEQISNLAEIAARSYKGEYNA